MPSETKSAGRAIDWNARYEAEDTPWDKGREAPPLVEFLEREKMTGRILVPGCGYGHDVRFLALQGARPVGLDIASSALHEARSYPKIGGEIYLEGDFFNLDAAFRNSFDYVFEHTCFCAIDPSLREDYVKAASRVLKAAGKLLAIFYLHIDKPEGPPFSVSSREIDRLFHGHFETLEKWVPGRAYPGRENREEMRLMRKSIRENC